MPARYGGSPISPADPQKHPADHHCDLCFTGAFHLLDAPRPIAVWISAASDVAGRFSNLGIVAVGILLVSGTINALFLIGGILALAGTDYGRLLPFKVTLFAAMVGLAGINRQYLLPRLFGDVGVDRGSRTIRWPVGSALAEIVVGLAVILIVGTLGIMAPASNMPAHFH